MMQTHSDVAIIGAGPAGCMAAIQAALVRGRKVILIEKNRHIGEKLLLTGQGRCNLTNSSDMNEFLTKYHNGNFLRNSFPQFFHTDLIDFFERNGLSTKKERGNRIFPKSDKSSDVVETLLKTLRQSGIQVIKNAATLSIKAKDNLFEIATRKGIFTAKTVILATGGKSYPQTGSTGDGYEFAAMFGHTIMPLEPALCGLHLKEKWMREWAGITLKNIEVSVYCNKHLLTTSFGELLFTHFGISGPTILNISGDVSENFGKNRIDLGVNLKPALTKEILDQRLQREFAQYPKKALKNIFKSLMPAGMITEFLGYCGIDETKKGNQISRKERELMRTKLQKLSFTVASIDSFEHSMVTRGGVCIKEINPKTMESKIVPKLFFAGEIIDIDGQTGGYNLQAAFTTGFVAGTHIKTGSK